MAANNLHRLIIWMGNDQQDISLLRSAIYMSKDDREQYFSVKEERKFEKTIRDDPPFKKALLEDETDA